LTVLNVVVAVAVVVVEEVHLIKKVANKQNQFQVILVAVLSNQIIIAVEVTKVFPIMEQEQNK